MPFDIAIVNNSSHVGQTSAESLPMPDGLQIT